MVYMSGSRNARNSASIVNRTNVCGGPKKAGLAPSVGNFISSNPNLIGAVNTQYGSLRELQPNLQKAVGRIENRDILGIGSGVKAGAGAAIGGNLGAALGLGESILEMPKVKSNLALQLYKKQNQGLGMFLDNNARNALLRQALDQQFQLNGMYPEGLLK